MQNYTSFDKKKLMENIQLMWLLIDHNYID